MHLSLGKSGTAATTHDCASQCHDSSHTTSKNYQTSLRNTTEVTDPNIYKPNPHKNKVDLRKELPSIHKNRGDEGREEKKTHKSRG
jgi:hypothetical protein